MRKACPVLLAAAVLTGACADGQLQPPPATVAAVEEAEPVAEPAAEPMVPAAAPAAPAAATPARPRQQPLAASAPAPAPAPAPAAAVRPASAAPSPAAAPVAEYREVVMPAGTTLPLRLATAVASDTSQVEDRVRATLRSDVTIDGQVLPAGTEVTGHVVEADRSGRVRGLARVALRFDAMRYEGEAYALRTDTVERVAEATKGEDAAKIGVGAAAGAALGALLGGGSGAAKGAAIGGAAGTGAVLATRGEEVRIEAGEPVDARLAAPVAITFRIR